MKHCMLKQKILQDNPSILLMQETKCTSTSIHSLMPKIWKGSQVMAIDANGTSGGIAITWNPNLLNLDNFTSTPHSLSTSFHILGTDLSGFVMNVYGPQSPSLKRILLDHITWFNSQHPDSLLIFGGDFNMITSLQEKKGVIELSPLKTFSSNPALMSADWSTPYPVKDSSPRTIDGGGSSNCLTTGPHSHLGQSP